MACFLKIGLACFTAFLSRAVGGHHGADGSAQGKKQWQSDEPAEIERVLAPPQVPVEEDIRRRPLVVAIKVHEKESKVVQRVDGRDSFIELDRVVESGPPVPHHDIGEMQIAVASAHEAHGGAFI